MSLIDIGTTKGLARWPSKVNKRLEAQSPEQVCVKVDPDASMWRDADGRNHSGRSIVVQGWQGYASTQTLRLTEAQAEQLAALLFKALDEKRRWRG